MALINFPTSIHVVEGTCLIIIQL